MAQLKDDCFAFDGGLMPVDDALTALAERVTCVVGTETVALRQALGRVLAEDVAAPRNVPPHDNSAVDGYAVFHADLNPDGETRLPVAGRIAASMCRCRCPLGRSRRSRVAGAGVVTDAPGVGEVNRTVHTLRSRCFRDVSGECRRACTRRGRPDCGRDAL